MSSFKTGIVTNKNGVDAIPSIYNVNQNVALVLSRRFNGNVIVFEIMLTKSRHIDSVTIFWLDLDPAYKAAKRKKNIPHDRDTFSAMDSLVYGITVGAKSSTRWDFHFNKFPKKAFFFEVHDTGVSCFCKSGGDKITKVHHLYIHDKPAFGILWPTVDYIDIVSFEKTIIERIKI